MLCGLKCGKSESQDTVGLGLQETAVDVERGKGKEKKRKQAAYGPSSHHPGAEPILTLDGREGEFL